MLFKYRPSRVIIIGLNNISLMLAKKLSVDNEVIILYDTDRPQQKYLKETDIMIEKIESSLISTLKKIQDFKGSTFISVTEDERFNLFSAQLAKKIGAKFSLALVYKSDYYNLNFDIDFIFNPYQIITDQINTKIMDTRLINVKNLIPGKINITNIQVKNDDSFSYLKIKNIELDNELIVAVNRNKKMLLPDADTQILPGDNLYIMYKRGLNDWLKIISFRQMSKRKLFILGGKDLGLFLINYWKNIFKPIVIIEPSLQQCNILASKLEKPLILHGEGTELQLIKQEGLNNSSIFLAASSNDLQNLVSSFGAQKIGCRNVVSLINESIHKEIAKLLKLNNFLFIPELVTDYVLNFLENKQKLNKYILGNQIYTGKIILNDNSLAVNKKIKDLKLPAGIIVGVIIRKGDTIIPDGENKLMSGDKIVIFFEKKLESKVKHIF